MKRIVPLAGTILCLIGCAGLPAVAAALPFLCNNWVLIPLEIALAAFAIVTMRR